jgi:hypothetical protein
MSVTRARLEVICQLHEADLVVICQLHEADWRLYVSNMRQVRGYL